ncbi:hypothetical protein ABAC460_23100 [Asticcacaulis sp. AC460]|uniref:fibronectin type III domain-containing protein n=1 Tax=Asticcacaulis sp. AC460 TaxID=1282360 RepID=UPI0003C3AC10|nr:fibronectin type III domain-containing protein [Asticcacaulis sp. AC460]ESQ86602.1 hypothetical protein ABAC460_23100 [Asticcacaulis sp. AC460]
MGDPISAFAAWVTQALGFTAGTAAYAAVYAAVYVATAYTVSTALSSVGRKDIPAGEAAYQTTKQPIPERMRAFGRVRISGSYMLYAAKDTDSYDVIALHDGEIESIEAYYLNDFVVTLNGSNFVISPDDKTFGVNDDRVRIYTRLGLATETSYSQATAALPSLWPATARGDGIASLLLICQNPPLDKFSIDYPQGLPAPSVEMKARKVYDWRRDDTRDGGVGDHRIDDADSWEWSDNPIVCLAHYLVQDVGKNFERVINPNLRFWSTAANVCDESVMLPDLSSQARYALGGVYYVSNAPSVVVDNMLKACSGYLAEDGRGGLIVYAGKWLNPEDLVEIDDTLDIIDGYYFERGVDAEADSNAFDIVYTHAAEAYKEGDAGRWRNEALISEAGEVRAGRLDLPWVQNHWQAQRIAKIHDAKVNARLRGYVVGGLSLIRCMGEMLVKLKISDCAALDGIVVMPTRVEIVDLISGKVRMTFVEMTEDAFAFEDDEYIEIDTAASGGTGTNTVGVPNINDYELLDYVQISPGVYQARYTLHLSNAYRSDVAYQYQYSTDGGATWSGPVYAGSTSDSGHADIVTGPMPSEAVILQCRAVFGGGYGGPATTEWGSSGGPGSGAFVPDIGAEAFGPVAPGRTYSAPDLTVTWTATGWPAVTGYRVFTTSGSSFTSPTDISGLITATSHVESGLAAGTYYLWVRAENAAGFTSVPVPTSPAFITIP